MLLPKKKKISAGLYVGSRSYVYLALEDSSAGVHVAASVSDSFSPPIAKGGSVFGASGAELSSSFGYVASSARVSRRQNINFAVPMSDSLVRVVTMPGLTCAEAKKAFRYEVERHFPFSADECVYDIDEIDYPLGGGSHERRFVVSAARRQHAENVFYAARSSGLRFCAMEPEQTAIERAVSRELPSEGGCVCIYAGVERSLVIFVWGGCGIYYRNIAHKTSVPGQSLDECAAALADDVAASVQFGLSRNDGFTFHDIYIFGPGATGRFQAVMSELFYENRVAVVSPERRFGLDFPAQEGWAAALGLALREYDCQA